MGGAFLFSLCYEMPFVNLDKLFLTPKHKKQDVSHSVRDTSEYQPLQSEEMSQVTTAKDSGTSSPE